MKRQMVGRGVFSMKCGLFLLAVFLTWASAAAGFFGSNLHFVTNLDDSGPGSLRDEIATAQAGDTIFFTVRGTIALTSGELLVSNSLDIFGPGATNLAISAGGQSRILEILSNSAVGLYGVTICDGHAADGAAGTSNSPVGGDGSDGGGIYDAGFLALDQCVVSNCAAGNGGRGAQPIVYEPSTAPPDATNWSGGAGGRGGGVYNSGELWVIGCNLISNSSGAGGDAGGDLKYGASGNSGGSGGAIYNVGAMTLATSIFQHDAAGRGGAGYGFPDYFLETVGGVHGGDGGAGGAVCDAGATVTFIDGCHFISNASGAGGMGGETSDFSADLGGSGGAGGAGGAVWCGGSTRMNNCALVSNETGDGGVGGIGWKNGGAGGGSGSGGAICCVGELSLTDCSCISNHVGRGGDGGFTGTGTGGIGGSGGSGGAVCAMGELTLTLCSCISNYAGLGGTGGESYAGLAGAGGNGGSGGAIFAAGVLRLEQCTVGGNSAGVGGQGGNNPSPQYYPYGAGVGGNGGLGGAFYCESDSKATNCTFNGNLAGNAGSPGYAGFNYSDSFQISPGGSDGGHGGAIFGIGAVVLKACTVSGNMGGNGTSASGSGGPAIVANVDPAEQGPDLSETNSQPDFIFYASSGGPGGLGGTGGIYSESSLNMVLCTLTGNMGGAGGWGGPSYSGWQGEYYTGGAGGGGGPGAVCCASSNGLFAVACTIAGNQGGTGGNGGAGDEDPYSGNSNQGPGGAGGAGGIATISGNLINTIVASNFGGAGGAGINVGPLRGSPGANGATDLGGTFTSLGYNLIGNADGSSGITNGVNGDLAGSTVASINPVLGPLADNGGPTFTMALLHGSPALDAGDDALLGPPYTLTTDQRGFPRKSGPHVDIGAFEYQYQSSAAYPAAHELTLSGNLVANGSSAANADSVSSGSGAPVAAQNFQLTFSDDTPGATYTVLATTNLSFPVDNWSIVGQPVQISPGVFQFTDGDSANNPQRYYRVSSP